MSDAKVCKINDMRIQSYTKRSRSGPTQIFYTGSGERDFERYRAEGGNCGKNVEMHDKPDTIRIQPPEMHYYAELIDGEWWWVNGCGQCNGDPRGHQTYVECKEHDVCRVCGCSREGLKEIPWGGLSGWTCKPCGDAEHEGEKQEALEAMGDDFDDFDYFGLSEIKCPYCSYQFSDSFESAGDDGQEHECHRCDSTFKVTAVHSLTFDCERINEG